MAVINDDNDFGAIVFAVVAATVVVGSLIYAVGKFDGTVQTASHFPTTEQTVPRIVPLAPQ